MNKKQTDVKKVTAQPEMLPAIINWALWPLWIFAGMTVCGTAGSLLIRFGGFDLIATMIVLGGFIGGIAVGLMRYLSQQWNISRTRWWIWALINFGLTAIGGLLAFTYFNFFQFWIPIGTITVTSMVVALITRWFIHISQRSMAGWLKSVFRISAVMIVVFLLILSFISFYIFQQ